jgi:hypothetical protein
MVLLTLIDINILSFLKISSALGWANDTGDTGASEHMAPAAEGGQLVEQESSTDAKGQGTNRDLSDAKEVPSTEHCPSRSSVVVSAAEVTTATPPPRGPCLCVELLRGTNLPIVQSLAVTSGFGQQDPYVLCRLLPTKQSIGRSG